MDIRERALQDAIADYTSGVYKSQRAAAAAHGISQSTLSTRLNGTTRRSIAHQHQQRLTPLQEEFLVEWILEEDARGYPPSHPRTREMANRILRMNGESGSVGRFWVPSFLRRNPRVASIVGRPIEAARSDAATPDQIIAFLDLFEATRIRLGIPIDRIWNMDETGVALGVCSNTRVLASSKKKKAYIKSPENREWVSIIESVSASGQKLRCMVVFKGQSLQTTWFPSEKVPNWLYTTSENGWTSNAIGVAWLHHIFIPQVKPTSTQPQLLILDGHGSHIDIDFLWTCKQNHIELLFLPAHSSHILQPLDLAPFSILKSKYRQEIARLSQLDDAAPVKKERFISCYSQAREEGLSDRIIRAGWRAAGLSPFNKELVLSSSQITNRCITPPPIQSATQLLDPLFSTPKRPQDFYYTQQALSQIESLSRSTRVVLSKASKALSLANTRAAGLEAENARLKHQLEALGPQKKRKRVTTDPNQRFADVAEIMKAMRCAADEQAQNAAKPAGELARNVAGAGTVPEFSSMCTQWRLN